MPVTWERLQLKLFKSLNRSYLKLIANAFSNAALYGMYVVIELHNYHRYKGDVDGSEQALLTH
jgi:endoglucanase